MSKYKIVPSRDGYKWDNSPYPIAICWDNVVLLCDHIEDWSAHVCHLNTHSNKKYILVWQGYQQIFHSKYGF